ncbi:SIMPL domain-containing protein [Vibrio hannami]|uniref:SIMPL domain-containing protein n=1 Tax=Vibrio hannami TaxID=2717094 RepID=UPI00240EF4E4|nr:SIMPL domain-containing protein [Vibrio hannami]MDG3088047.1 SIMPL domain-containing protein [Vibrio hannami]
MNQKAFPAQAILGIFICLGLGILGYFISSAAIEYKLYERTVSVKGLSEKEYSADIVIWPIRFNVADNELASLYKTIDQQSSSIRDFLTDNGINADEITLSAPSITDKSAQQYGGDPNAAYRYTAFQTVTVYSSDIETVRKVMSTLSDLGKQGIVFTGGGYDSQAEYLFTRLNEVKPEMIEEATKNARAVAEKFATDSKSRLGKIKKAYQGQFSIRPRDRNNPHIKKVRVVTTVEYYLSD